MEQTLQIQLLERVLHHVKNGTTDVSAQPAGFSRTIYSSEERLASEREAIFRRFPLVVGFSSQLGAPGSYLTHDLTGVPLLVVRGGDGVVRGFLNSCRHRGAKVATQPNGTGCRRFVCPYHAWSYDLDGKLHSITEKRCFPNVDPAQSGLVQLACAERHGIIFVVPTPGIELDIDAYLGDFGRDFESFGLDKYHVSATKIVPGNIDWKLMVEANQESYHINFLHGRTAGRRYRDQCSLADFSPPHSRSVLVHASTGRAPMSDDKSRWRLLEHADLVYLIFPNTLTLWAGDGVQVITTFPQGRGQAIMQGARLDPPHATTRAAKEYAAAFYGNYWQTILEDLRVSETIQAGASAPTEALLQLGGNEVTISEFHRHIERALNGELRIENFRSAETLDSRAVKKIAEAPARIPSPATA
jgi:phenylpropionate dioxygenase-like ring-hydroxylating dioxygenase large terminal subunit